MMQFHTTFQLISQSRCVPELRRDVGMEMKSEAAARTSWSSSCSSVKRLFHKASVVDRPDTHENDTNNKLYSHLMTDEYFHNTHPVAAEGYSTHFWYSWPGP